MADVHTKEKRSHNMSRIRGRDTRPEMMLRSALHAIGLRFRLHASDLPGRPDIILPKHRLAVFVHGCFWHRHADCKYCTTPAANAEFWREKFSRNVERDLENSNKLVAAGWRVYVAWECEIKRSPPAVAEAIRQLD
ncbi:very short patch repair endonuclease [Aminobacter sp. HY435]|uniref:very short patch repair endonuclease n=1 Tax=Aminobacter sp. HY435 TaxID=2970917 RepID=UPI0022B9B51F|nr:very short patch repair endonuclease [Aminobacter sp. HY435]